MDAVCVWKNRDALKANPHVIFSLDCCGGADVQRAPPNGSKIR